MNIVDTVNMMAGYADVLVIRHPERGAIRQAVTNKQKPVISAGEGTGEHPTQALLDVFTIREEIGTVNGLTVSTDYNKARAALIHVRSFLLQLQVLILMIGTQPDSSSFNMNRLHISWGITFFTIGIICCLLHNR